MSPAQHKALISPSKGAKFEVGLRDTPTPGPGQVLVKVHAAALNPVDHLIEDFGVIVADFPAVAGSDGAGTIEAVAEDVTNWKKGDRVFFPGAFFSADRGTFQQFAIADALRIAKIPDSLSFDEASTIPLGVSTAAGGMYQEVRSKWPDGAQLFPPWEQGGRGKYHDQPIVVIGGSSSVGQYALQLAKLSGFNPIITTASRSNDEYCKRAGATHVIDYHVTPYSALYAAVADITPKPISYVYDAISLDESQKASWEILSPGGTVTFTLLPKVGKEGEVVEGKRAVYVHANVNEKSNHNIGNALYANLTQWIEEGVIRPNKVEVVEGGLGNVSSHLQRLKKGQVSGLKLVVHPQETP
ncbi:GroES-like protein [Dentipellis sp. KUC8613]|nr:GroES-like protein [Dentipellis sp. KUC8613]